jgi:hypothetical protein
MDCVPSLSSNLPLGCSPALWNVAKHTKPDDNVMTGSRMKLSKYEGNASLTITAELSNRTLITSRTQVRLYFAHFRFTKPRTETQMS